MCSLTRFIAAALVAGLLISPAPAAFAQPAAATLDVPRLQAEMGRYCMAELCAGMSMRELAALPGARLVLDSPLREERLCNSPGLQSKNGSLFTADGYRYDVGFYVIPGPGRAEDVYRVVVVQLRIDGISTDELDGLRRTLVERYGLRPSGAPFPTAWFGSAPMLDVSVAQEQEPVADTVVSTLRLIVAPAQAFVQTANQPWCLGEPVPPLPPPRRALPRL